MRVFLLFAAQFILLVSLGQSAFADYVSSGSKGEVCSEALSSDNPFLKSNELPLNAFPFDKIKSEHFVPALKVLIAQALEKVDKLVRGKQKATFENTILFLDNLSHKISFVSNAYTTLSGSANTEDSGLEELQAEVQGLLREFNSVLFMNEGLFRRVRTLYRKRDAFDEFQKRLIVGYYKSFLANSIGDLESIQNEHLRLKEKLSDLTRAFNRNSLERNKLEHFHLIVEDENELIGISEQVLALAKANAQELGVKGWVFSASYTEYGGVMADAESSSLRERYFRAHQGIDDVPGFSNENIVLEIVKTRQAIAQLLGYDSYAHMVLKGRMALTPETVTSFLNELRERAIDAARADEEKIIAFRKSVTGEEGPILPWDASYWSKKYMEETFEFDSESLKPYLEVSQVVQGGFDHISKLLGWTFTERPDLPVYHKDVVAYEVTKGDAVVGLVYVDIFERREMKRGGAWAAPLNSQRYEGGDRVTPVASLNANFTKGVDGEPTLLTMGNVRTFFHELGHVVHALSSDVQYAGLSGFKVPWDFVELPSQFMENYLNYRESVDMFARHYETGELIPEELWEARKRAKGFGEAGGVLSHFMVSMIDLSWYLTTDFSSITSVLDFEMPIRELARTSERPVDANYPLSTRIAHYISGGYSAGYYSYAWSNFLDADAFEAFLETSLFDPETAKRWGRLLASGGSKDAMKLYEEFRGRKPDGEAFWRRAGIRP